MKRILTALAMTLATTTAQAAEMKVRPGGVIMDISGEIFKGDGVKFKSLVKRNPSLQDITLNSVGGLLGEGISMASTIDKHRLNAHVLANDVCYSACAMAFLGGVNQSLNGVLAFHNGQITNGKLSRQEVSEKAQQVGLWYYTAFLEMGYHSALPKIILHNTNAQTFLVFKNKSALDRYYVGPPETTPLAKFTTGWPVTDAEINKRLKGL